MKVLVLNGSPKGNKSNTMKLTNSFLNGLDTSKTQAVDVINVCNVKIEPCLGCFCCWTKTPGKCVIHDDMEELLNKYLVADLVIWSFPLYYFSLPSKLKALMDRLLPMNLPCMTERPDGGSGHPSRFDMSGKKYIMISTCGFYSKENNYDAIIRQFDIMYAGNITKIICPEGELFSQPQLKTRTNAYLEYVKTAGVEYANSSSISKDTEKKLSELLYPPKVFIKMADASWEISEQSPANDLLAASNQEKDRSYSFTKQMAALYNAASWNKKDLVLEMYYTDSDKTYQMILGKEDCNVITENFIPFTTRIETPFTVWLDISEGNITGEQAMMEHKYKVLGDFNLMLHWDDYFGFGNSGIETKKEEIKQEKKTNMTLLIAPWFVIWVLLAINPIVGAIGGILTCAFLPILSIKWKYTIFDNISIFAVSIICLLSLLGISIRVTVPLSYLLFGIMWSVTGFMKVPLTAYYSMNDYNGEKALNNPLFMKTNRILTMCWGVLYLVTPTWTYLIMGTELSSLIGLINSALPILLGIFTTWFQKWYPAKIARG